MIADPSTPDAAARPHPFSCRLCGAAGEHRHFAARERQFGLGDAFAYVECADCGSLQIDQVPDDLGRFYPTHYYAFNAPAAAPAQDAWWRRTLRARRSRSMLDGRDPVGRLAAKLGPDYFAYPWAWFRQTGVGLASAILDVGCGHGKLLRSLRDQGFRRLHGVDPFIAAPIVEPGLRIDRCELSELQGEFDLVMLHHSLEHVSDLQAQLQAAAQRCRPGGHVLVRLPIADCQGWRHYGEHWFALDAPRHLNIPSRRALSAVAARCGLHTESVVCDMDAICLWASELYLRGLPYMDEAGRVVGDPGHPLNPFSPEEAAAFKRRAREINAADEGDTACFVFRKTPA
jgi:SAM-dependent methyltransferase